MKFVASYDVAPANYAHVIYSLSHAGRLVCVLHIAHLSAGKNICTHTHLL